MWYFALSTHELSPLVWRRLFSEYSFELPEVMASLTSFYSRLEKDRTMMDYKTGSISFSSAMTLYVLTRKIDPTTVLEVGTFIGRSASAMTTAMDRGEARDRVLYTCDFSNNFVMDTSRFKTQIKAMPKTPSTGALRAAVAAGRPVDLFHFDGRLATEDLEMVAALAHDRTVIALDDFEGIEKGVVNAMLLKRTPKFANHFLIAPPGPDVHAPYGLNDRCLTALLVPPGVFQLVPQ